jgi:hypothetical protein
MAIVNGSSPDAQGTDQIRKGRVPQRAASCGTTMSMAA